MKAKIFCLLLVSVVSLSAMAQDIIRPYTDIKIKPGTAVLGDINYPLEKRELKELKKAEFTYVFELIRTSGSDWAVCFSYQDGSYGISHDGFNVIFNKEKAVFFPEYESLLEKELIGEDGIAGWASCADAWTTGTKVKYTYSYVEGKCFVIVYGV